MGIMDASIRQAKEAEMNRLHTEALKLNAQVVYLYGHGTRAYILTEVTDYRTSMVYSVQPLSGGMEWSYDRRPFSTVPLTL